MIPHLDFYEVYDDGTYKITWDNEIIFTANLSQLKGLRNDIHNLLINLDAEIVIKKYSKGGE